MTPSLVSFGFEKNDQVVVSDRIPWFASNITVELSVRVPVNYQFEVEDFVLVFDSGLKVRGAFSPTQQETKAIRGKVRFLFPNDLTNASGKVMFRRKIFTDLNIPLLSKSQFISGLSVNSMVLQGVFKNKVLGFSSFSGFGSSGLMATFGVESDFGLKFLGEVSLQLSYSLDGKGGMLDLEPLVPDSPLDKMHFSVPFSGLTRQVGNLELEILADGVSIGKRYFKGINQVAFQKTLTVEKKSFVAWREDGSSFFTEDVKSISKVARLGPVFFLKTTVAGLAGITEVKIYGYLHGSHEPFLVWQGKMVVGNAPVFLGPVSLDVKNIRDLKKFEVWAGKIVVGTLGTGSKPAGAFTAEGAIANIEELERAENISVQEVFNKLKGFISPN